MPESWSWADNNNARLEKLIKIPLVLAPVVVAMTACQMIPDRPKPPAEPAPPAEAVVQPIASESATVPQDHPCISHLEEIITTSTQYSCGPDIPTAKCPKNPVVTLVEFSSPSCPYCRAEAASVQEFLKKMSGYARWYPRVHPIGRSAGQHWFMARLMQCAKEQDKLVPMFIKTMAAMTGPSGARFYISGARTRQLIADELSQGVGLDSKRFQSCYEEEQAQIQKSREIDASRLSPADKAIKKAQLVLNIVPFETIKKNATCLNPSRWDPDSGTIPTTLILFASGVPKEEFEVDPVPVAGATFPVDRRVPGWSRTSGDFLAAYLESLTSSDKLAKLEQHGKRLNKR